MLILLAALLACFCAQALAEEPAPVHNDTHRTADRLHGIPTLVSTGSQESHRVVSRYDLYCEDCGRVIEKNYKTAETEAAHQWSVIRQEPTCDEDGAEIKICTGCGETVRETILSLGHQFAGASQLMKREPGDVLGSGEFAGQVIGRVIAAPTCAGSGQGTLVCLRCQAASQSVSIPAMGHQWSEWEDAQVPPERACVTEVTVVRRCQFCDQKESKTVSPAPGHQFKEIGRVGATCTEKGQIARQCVVCRTVDIEQLPALGHQFSDIEVLVKQQAGDVRLEGKTAGRVSMPSTCVESGTGVLLCLRCGQAETVVIPPGGHRWGEWEEEELPKELVCLSEVRGTRRCMDCLEEETQVLRPAPGHVWAAVRYAAPTCEASGTALRHCAVCGIEDEIDSPALGHSYMWIEKTTPSPNGTGVREYICTICGNVAETQSFSYSQMYYNNTITSFGPMTRELIGGNVWNRVTPIDLSQDGVFTFPLVASNLYTIGTVTVILDRGVQTVTYRLNSSDVLVHSEALVIYPGLDALRTGENAVAGAFDTPLDLAEHFGADARVILAITLKADYNAGASGVQEFKPDQEQIDLMTALIR